LDLRDSIRIIEDFPAKGISFKDITPLLADGEALRESINQMVDHLKDMNIDLIAGPEARGFLFGVPVANELGIGFIPVRKPGKLPYDTYAVEYDLEYGKDRLEIHKDAIKPGQRIAVVDDLLATGGTVAAVTKLIEEIGGEVASLNFLIELTDLKGRDKLQGYDINSLIKYDI